MEGCATSVSAVLTLPSQPTTGTVTYIPLGGDGYRAPFAQYNILGFTLAGDASGGSALLQVKMDDRYTCLVPFMQASRQGTDADAFVRMEVTAPGLTAVPITFGETVVSSGASISPNEIRTTWQLPPQLLPGQRDTPACVMVMDNIGVTETFRLSLLIYLFNLNVRQVSAMGGLLWAKGST